MSLLALGINHKTAPVEIRERAVFPAEALDAPLRELTSVRGVREAAIVSTCNRTEVYCDLDGVSEREIIHWFHEYHRLDQSQLTPYLFSHLDDDAVRHLLRVCSGLDSLVLGEPQILGQIKQAYAHASQCGTIGSQLTKLFQHAFSVAKQVRTDTAIGSSPVSVAFAAVSLAKQIFGDLDKRTALLLGAGETVELAVRHLAGQGIGKLIIANRTVARAEHLAAEFGARAVPLTDVPNVLHEADIVIASTGAPLPVLGKGAAEAALKKRKHRPMFMVDIAVPRDIEPQVGELDDVFLYTVDDLQEVIEEGRRSRAEAAEQAEEIVDAQVEEFGRWLRSLNAVGTIRDYREHAMAIQSEALAKARQQLASGKPADKVLEQLAHTLTNKMLHAPTTAMRRASAEGHHHIIEAAQQLFGLDGEQP
jgi:glutamyl-tRNA reductase